MQLDEYIQSIKQYPLPQNPMGQLRTLAKELAGGAVHDLWLFRFEIRSQALDDSENSEKRLIPSDESLKAYLQARWNGFKDFPDFRLLERMGYLSEIGSDRFSIDYLLTHAAFELLEEIEPTKIFISYKRSESSAFALLVMTMLKQVGLNPFLDLALIPGEDWSAGLKDRVESADYFIALLGPQTLSSRVVLEELAWAMDAGKLIMPVWHSGFIYQSGAWSDVPVKIDRLLSMTHTIRVLEENPLAYHNAVLELLNRLGFTP